MDTAYFKKNIVSLNNAFIELEKVRLNHKPTKKILILDQSNVSPDMMNTIRNNNAFEDNFYKHHNKYKLTPHIDYNPKYTSLIMHHMKQDMAVLITNHTCKI